MALLALAAPPAAARSRLPYLARVRCVPAAACRSGPRIVHQGGLIRLSGRRLRRGQRVLFPRAYGGRPSVRAMLRVTGLGLVAKVPPAAHSGKVAVLGGAGRSNTAGPLRILPPLPPPRRSAARLGPALAGQGMWIWQLDRSTGGDANAIASQAAAAGVTTIFLKSSDGGTDGMLPQYTSAVVQSLRALGLHVCAWQFVYGNYPTAEAALGAQAVADGAECLAVDAEDQYAGRYAAAQAYLGALRAAVGADYPLGFTSFPFVDLHPALPFSVFLGPGGAQANLPQMYWKAIGTTVDAVYGRTYEHNSLYGRSVLPLGQTYDAPSPADLVRFRQLAAAYGAAGLSFFSWQGTAPEAWAALAQPLAPLGLVPVVTPPVLGQGAKGDEVVWLQEHLAAEQSQTPISGVFDAATAGGLQAFQAAHGLPVSGQADAATWPALLALAPVPVTWTDGSSGPTAMRSRTRPRTLPPPASARLRSHPEFSGRAAAAPPRSARDR